MDQAVLGVEQQDHEDFVGQGRQAQAQPVAYRIGRAEQVALCQFFAQGAT